MHRLRPSSHPALRRSHRTTGAMPFRIGNRVTLGTAARPAGEMQPRRIRRQRRSRTPSRSQTVLSAPYDPHPMPHGARITSLTRQSQLRRRRDRHRHTRTSQLHGTSRRVARDECATRRTWHATNVVRDKRNTRRRSALCAQQYDIGRTHSQGARARQIRTPLMHCNARTRGAGRHAIHGASWLCRDAVRAACTTGAAYHVRGSRRTIPRCARSTVTVQGAQAARRSARQLDAQKKRRP